MKTTLHLFQRLSIVLLILLPQYSIGQLSVSNNLTTTATIQQLFGAGVTISNISIQGDTSNALGVFDGTMSNIGLDSGIIMSTGNITNALPGQFYGTNLGNPGDPLLSSVIGGTTYDAFVIEFDIASTCDTIAIEYVFASKEYPLFVGSFNDAFSFFITGHAYTSPTNIALVPGTTNTSVSINNVNASTNSNYYINNTAGTVGYLGFTVPLIAYAQVIPDSLYHVKLVVADAVDAFFDSSVFLKRKGVCGNPGIVAMASINSGLNTNTSTIYLDEGSSETISFQHALEVNFAKQIYFQINGSAGNGVDFITIPNSLTLLPGTSQVNLPIAIISDCDFEGVEKIELIYTDSSLTCSGAIYTDTFNILINNIGGIPAFDLGPDQAICSGDTLTGVDANLSGYTYAWTALNGSTINISDSAVANPYFFGSNNSVDPQMNLVELSVTSAAGCVKKDTLAITIGGQPEAAFTVATEACVDDTLNFMDNSNGAISEWLWDFGQGTSVQQNPTFAYDSVGAYSVILTVKDGDCLASQSELINIYPAIEYTTPVWPDSICTGDSEIIDISGTGYTDLTWDIGDGVIQTSQDVQISYQDSGNYTISLKLNNQGCEEIIEKNIVAYVCEATNSITELAPHLIKVYPNPASEKIIIELSQGIEGEVIVSDIRGRILKKEKTSSTKTIIASDSWVDGIYFLTVYTNKGMYREKILVR